MNDKEYKFTISVSRDGFTSKPSRPGSLYWIRREGITIDELANYILTGHSFTGDFGFEEFPTFRHKNRNNFKGNSLFSIDFDDVEFESLEELINSLKLKPFLAYETFTHKQEGRGNRYRVIYAFNRPITKYEQYKAIGKWLEKMNNIKKYDKTGNSACQEMHGTTSTAKLIKLGNVLDVPNVGEVVETKNFVREPSKEELETIENWKKRNSKKIDEEIPHLITSPKNLIFPRDIKYVSDNYMIANGYAIDVEGAYLIRYRKEHIKDGQHRKFKLFHIMKGVAQLNPNANLNDLLIYGWMIANHIMYDKLTRDEVITMVFNAYFAVRYEKNYDQSPKFGHKKGFGVVPGRSGRGMGEQVRSRDEYVADRMRFRQTEEWKEMTRVLNSILEVDDDDETIDTSDFVGGIEPDEVVLCTEEEATFNVNGFNFFAIQKEVKERKKRDMGKYYQKKQKRIKDFNEFQEVIKNYNGKLSSRKVLSYLKEQGFSIAYGKVLEFIKCFGILHTNSIKYNTQHIGNNDVKKRSIFSEAKSEIIDEATEEQREEIRKDLEAKFNDMWRMQADNDYRLDHCTTATDLISLIDDELIETDQIRPYYLSLSFAEQLNFETLTNDQYIDVLRAKKQAI